MGLHAKGRLLLPCPVGETYINLTINLAYYVTELITTVKSFMVQGLDQLRHPEFFLKNAFCHLL
jgi:hypothetical protein